MRSAIFAGLFAATALATPLVARDEVPCDGPPCMTLSQAQQVANNFRDLIVNYSNATAQSYLAPTYQDYADSVGELINNGCPTGPITLGQATFPSLEAFMVGQGSQPSIPFEILNLWQTCDTVALRWRTTVSPNATEFVTGIIILETVYNAANTAAPFQISTSYSEFNSGAWLVDLGVFKPDCSKLPTPPSKRAAVPQLPGRRMA